VPAGAPRLFAIWAAVEPFPYRFEASAWAEVCAVAAFEPDELQVALDPVPPPVEQDVLWFPCAVELVGLTPDCDGLLFASAPPCVDALELVSEVWSFFSWPGAFAEFPGEPWEAVSVAEAVGVLEALLSAPLPFPWPLPARAEPAKTASATTSAIVLVMAAVRFVISFSPRYKRHFRGA
jgi:hypothetical protein